MLTFLVLLPLHVATLHRCLVVWVAVYMKGWGGGGHVNVPCTSSATCCYAAQMCGSVGCCIHEGVRWGGACERSLYFFRYMLLRCTDVW